MHLIKREDKRGQYFLIAAIIIVVVILGLAVGINNNLITKKDTSRTYDLSKELKLESESVVNYGIFKQQDLQNILDNFVVNYSTYIGGDNSVYFVYGDAGNISSVSYRQDSAGTISLDYGGTKTTITIEKRQLKKERVSGSGKDFNVTIGQINYPVTLNEGENFFFVIQEPRNNETG